MVHLRRHGHAVAWHGARPDDARAVLRVDHAVGHAAGALRPAAVPAADEGQRGGIQRHPECLRLHRSRTGDTLPYR